MNRHAARELPEITTLRECRCERRHTSHLDFVQCAIPNSRPLSKTSAQFAVIQFCGTQPSFTLFQTFWEASSAYDTSNVWSCFAESGCRGFHELRLVVV
ncbi:hypothetical protein CVN56_29795 [Rhodococcus sp. AQ5-07]|nr:hypothetical protein CVN56_29795 [Rhodococcus sp. AQ5-07]